MSDLQFRCNMNGDQATAHITASQHTSSLSRFPFHFLFSRFYFGLVQYIKCRYKLNAGGSGKSIRSQAVTSCRCKQSENGMLDERTVSLMQWLQLRRNCDATGERFLCVECESHARKSCGGRIVTMNTFYRATLVVVTMHKPSIRRDQGVSSDTSTLQTRTVSCNCLAMDCNAEQTRNSAIADKPRDSFRGQSRSPNMAPFDILRIWFPNSVL